VLISIRKKFPIHTVFSRSDIYNIRPRQDLSIPPRLKKPL